MTLGMRMSFRTSCTLCVIMFACLSLGLLVSPALFSTIFRIDHSVAVEVMERRSAILMIGLGALIYSLRDLPDGKLRRHSAAAIVVLMIGMAILGLVELYEHRVGVGIWIAIVPEIVFAGLFLRHAVASSNA